MDDRDLLLSARLSHWIYGANKRESSDWLFHIKENLKVCYPDEAFCVESVQRENVRCAVVSWHDRRIFVFCGTNDMRDWLTNIDVAKAAFFYNSGRVHCGFMADYKLVRKSLHDYYTGGSQLIFTGHSLGGALATLAARDAGRFASVYTFGQPRVGDKIFASQYKMLISEHFRVVHNNDIVARIPSAWRFHHVGKELYADRRGVLHRNISAWETLRDRLLGRLDSIASLFTSSRLGPTDGIKDHAMSGYLDIVESKGRRM